MRLPYPEYVDCGQGATILGALVMPSLVLDVIPAHMNCGHFKPQDLSGLIEWCELQQTIRLQLILSSNVNNSTFVGWCVCVDALCYRDKWKKGFTADMSI